MATDKQKKSFLSMGDLLTDPKLRPKPKPVLRQSWADHERDLGELNGPGGMSEKDFLGYTPGDKD